MRTLLILFILIQLSCNYPGLGIDYATLFNDHNDPEPIVLPDTCTSYTEVTDPAFLSWFVNFDILPDTIQFYYYHATNQHTPIDPVLLFGDSWIQYNSGINIGGFVNGYQSGDIHNPSIVVKDGSGAFHTITFSNQHLNGRGCMTFDQFWNELLSKPSVRYLNFNNTGYTQDQVMQVLNFILEDCKAGRWQINLKSLTFTIPQETIDELVLRGWDVITN